MNGVMSNEEVEKWMSDNDEPYPTTYPELYRLAVNIANRTGRANNILTGITMTPDRPLPYTERLKLAGLVLVLIWGVICAFMGILSLVGVWVN